jgi:Ca-activated chloride channel family protein
VKFAMDDEPVAVGFIFDVSGSISSRLQQYLLAALEFFKNADSDDEFFLVEFQSAPKLVVPLTKNAGEIDYPIMMTQSND